MVSRQERGLAMEYGALDGKALVTDPESASREKDDTPKQWQPHKCLGEGAGLWEFQGYEAWTPEEKKLYRQKWGIGQVSIRLPIADALSVFALIWGFLPYIIPLWWLIWMALSAVEHGAPDFFPTYGLCVAVVFVVLNEGITKKICRKLCSPKISARPPEAVCNHAGMPSGHVLNSWTLMVWCILEEVFDHIGHPTTWVLVTVAVMGPVPWARWYNRDHTGKQVWASVVASLFLGALAYVIRRHFFPKHTIPV